MDLEKEIEKIEQRIKEIKDEGLSSPLIISKIIVILSDIKYLISIILQEGDLENLQKIVNLENEVNFLDQKKEKKGKPCKAFREILRETFYPLKW